MTCNIRLSSWLVRGRMHYTKLPYRIVIIRTIDAKPAVTGMVLCTVCSNNSSRERMLVCTSPLAALSASLRLAAPGLSLGMETATVVTISVLGSFGSNASG